VNVAAEPGALIRVIVCDAADPDVVKVATDDACPFCGKPLAEHEQHAWPAGPRRPAERP